MTELRTTANHSWSAPQVALLALCSLLVGVSIGRMVHKFSRGRAPEAVPAASAPAPNVVPAAPVSPAFSSVPSMPSPADLKLAADSQAVPLIEELKGDPTNAALLTKIGNIYYDAKQYPIAIEYYQRALKEQPKDTGVRTDLGTAYWYTGDADKAVKEFQQALADEPNKANALFNLGIVQWKAKHDTAAAVATWQKLLASNPGFEGRVKVEQLIAEAQGSAPQKP